MVYKNFAYVYDKLMDNVDYIRWVDFLEKIYKKYKINPKLILELACGTGNISLELSKRGYEVIGVDISPEMLSVAREKAVAKKQDILFLQQDMTNFELYGTVDSILCFMDGINYITNPKKLDKMFKLANNYLNPEGLFIFDIRSEYGLKETIGNNTFAENLEDVSYIWQNFYDAKKKVSSMDVSFFVKQDNLYKRFNELHKLKSYDMEEIKEKLQNSGFELLEIFDDLSIKHPKTTSERIFFVARKNNFLKKCKN